MQQHAVVLVGTGSTVGIMAVCSLPRALASSVAAAVTRCAGVDVLLDVLVSLKCSNGCPSLLHGCKWLPTCDHEGDHEEQP